MLPDEPNEEERLEQLDQDGPTPFQPADPNPSSIVNTGDPMVAASSGSDLPDDHPATDTGIDSTELYDEGISGAAEVEDQSGQTAIGGYSNDTNEDDALDDQAL